MASNTAFCAEASPLDAPRARASAGTRTLRESSTHADCSSTSSLPAVAYKDAAAQERRRRDRNDTRQSLSNG